MNANDLLDAIDAEFYTGVPDSQLKALCDCLMDHYGIGRKHIIAANEGNCVALAAGFYLATGKPGVVYLQNSGIGNIINPVASLLSNDVYGIPVIFIVGWRGEPSVYDEPQHVFQGKVTRVLLDDVDIYSYVIDTNTTGQQICEAMAEFQPLLQGGKSVAFVVKKGALQYAKDIVYHNKNMLLREDVVRQIVLAAQDNIIVSTTGKTSRELFEIREKLAQAHDRDFLTVGSMGHCSSIALGMALQKPDKKIWCIDGDGAAIMHMGAMAVIGANSPQNLVHVVINNNAHESVGGMPTISDKIRLAAIARACAYPCTYQVSEKDGLETVLVKAAQSDALTFIEIRCAIGSRKDLGRPAKSPMQNKTDLMRFLGQ